MCRKKTNKEKNKKENKEKNKKEIINDDNSCSYSYNDDEWYNIVKNTYLNKTTDDLKQDKNFLEGKIYKLEVNSNHFNKIYPFLTVLVSVFTIMYSFFNKEDKYANFILIIAMAIFACGCLWIFYKESSDAHYNQMVKEECIVRMAIVNEILQERNNDNIDTEKHINTKQQ